MAGDRIDGKCRAVFGTAVETASGEAAESRERVDGSRTISRTLPINHPPGVRGAGWQSLPSGYGTPDVALCLEPAVEFGAVTARFVGYRPSDRRPLWPARTGRSDRPGEF